MIHSAPSSILFRPKQQQKLYRQSGRHPADFEIFPGKVLDSGREVTLGENVVGFLGPSKCLFASIETDLGFLGGSSTFLLLSELSE